MNIFFDLDGTLLDSRLRLHRLFCHLTGTGAIGFDEYWSMKREQIDHRAILNTRLGYNDAQIEQFLQDWLEMIELPEWLSHDVPFEGVTDFLVELKPKHCLFLITARQFGSRMEEQIQRFGWLEIFKKVLVANKGRTKDEIIRANVKPQAGDWMVGDTGVDILAGKALGMRTVGVLSGFRCENVLRRYNPDFIVDNVLKLGRIFDQEVSLA